MILSIDYVSDGCSGQHKSYKALLNLCHHKLDFGLDATWAFFATSHGKSPCDGIGGTVKRKVLRASLQRPVTNQILTFRVVEEYCKSSIDGITFLTIDKEDMVAVRERLEIRYQLGDTVPGTRSCHHFIPTSQYTIQGRQLSVDTTIFIDHSFLDMPAPLTETLESLKPNDYITCIFHGHWWLVLIESVNKEEKDLTCKFLHPHGPTNQFHWPDNDRGWVPLSRVIMKVQTPRTSVNGRTYFITEEEKNKTQNYFERFA